MAEVWKSFRGRLTLCCGGLALLLGLVLALFLHQAAENQVLTARSVTLQNVSQNAANRLLLSLGNRQRDIILLSQSALMTQPPWRTEAIQATLDRARRGVPFYAWLGLADKDGNVVVGTDGLLLGENVSEATWFEKGRQRLNISAIYADPDLSQRLQQLPASSPSYITPLSNEPRRFMDFSAPVRVDIGQVSKTAGVLVAHVSWDWLRDVLNGALSSQAAAEGVELWLVDHEGQVIHPYAPNERLQLNWPHDTSTVVMNWPSGQAYLTASTQVSPVSGLDTGWRVVARQKTSDALASLAAFRTILIFSGLLGAALIMLFAYYIAKYINKPLEHLTLQAQGITQGRTFSLSTLPNAPHEIEQLSQALTSMMTTVTHQKQALEHSNQELEERVHERTSELNDAYHALVTQAQGISDLYNYAPVGYHSLDKRGVFRFVNDRELQWLGYSRDEVVERMNIRHLLTPESCKVFDSQAQYLQNEQTQPSYDLEFVRKNGETFWARVNTASVLDSQGQFLFSRTALVDITHVKLLENRLRDERLLNSTIIHTTSDGIALYNSHGVCILANQATADLVGTRVEDLLHQNFHEINSWKVTGLYEAALSALQGRSNEIVMDTTSSFGKKLDCMVTVAPLLHKGETMVLCVFKDVSELVRANRELARAARVDTLTGVSNRLAGTEKLTQEFARMQRTQKPFCVLMIDIDYFKKVNDTYGHECGDKVLIAVAQALNNSVRVTDMVARFGGEEFVVILPEIEVPEAMNVAEKIRQRVEEILIPEENIRVTVSIGVAGLRLSDTQYELALKHADAALYLAKRQGRNQVVCAHTDDEVT